MAVVRSAEHEGWHMNLVLAGGSSSNSSSNRVVVAAVVVVVVLLVETYSWDACYTAIIPY